jgi:hypothetical protein
MTESRDQKKSAADVVRDAWKRTERARAAAEIPFVLWQAGGAPVPTPVQTNDPKQQRIESQIQNRSEIEWAQDLQQQWAENEQVRLEREARRAGEKPARTQDRSRTRD